MIINSKIWCKARDFAEDKQLHQPQSSVASYLKDPPQLREQMQGKENVNAEGMLLSVLSVVLKIQSTAHIDELRITATTRIRFNLTLNNLGGKPLCNDPSLQNKIAAISSTPSLVNEEGTECLEN